jgi:copper(I)-binding protein
MKRVLLVPLLFLSFLSANALAQVKIEKPWLRATPPGAAVGGGYMTIRNAGAAPDKLVGASSPAAGRVELHVTSEQNGVMKMQPVAGYDVPAKGSFELKPGGAHLMFMELKAPFKEGDRVPVTLKFEKAGEVKVEFPVGGLGSGAAPMPTHDHGKMKM